MFELRVIAVRWLSEDIFELSLDRAGIRFTPGECAVLFSGDDDSRPYSIASGADEPELRFLIRRMSGGSVSGWLSERRPGDPLRMSFPFGEFRPGQHGDPAIPPVFIATGVGIAPFLSYLRTYPEAPAPTCLYGVRHLREASCLDLLRTRTRLSLAVSREDAAGCARGRVTGLLDTPAYGPATHVYLCGLDAMVDEVSRWLHARGVPSERIHTEVFFFR